MKIGYPCINNSIGCTANRTFRLKSYSEELLIEKISINLACLEKTLKYNLDKGFLFFRIGSGLVPFASHQICDFNWQKYFEKDFLKIGEFIKKNQIRISMHPDQFVVINSNNKEIVKRSVEELKYHCEVLNLMDLDSTAKIQIHVGGVYGEKEKSIQRFIKSYKNLSQKIKKRLVVENDDKSYCAKDCLEISREVGIPIIFDTLHHECLNEEENLLEIFKEIIKTWKKKDGLPMVDYSNRVSGDKKCRHVQTLNSGLFEKFIRKTSGLDFDIMLEIKDKEISAERGLNILRNFSKKEIKK
jgi:UV DNA damage endonuclease